MDVGEFLKMKYRHPKEKVDEAIKMLKAQGHEVETQVRGTEGKFWFQVDCRMLVSWDEMQKLADGTCTLEGLEEQYRRKASKAGRSLKNTAAPAAS